MGASQSSKSQQFATTNELRTSSKSHNSTSSICNSNKNSFGKQQLNKLLRKGHTAASRRLTESNNKSDESPTSQTNGHQSKSPSKASKSIRGQARGQANDSMSYFVTSTTGVCAQSRPLAATMATGEDDHYQNDDHDHDDDNGFLSRPIAKALAQQAPNNTRAIDVPHDKAATPPNERHQLSLGSHQRQTNTTTNASGDKFIMTPITQQHQKQHKHLLDTSSNLKPSQKQQLKSSCSPSSASAASSSVASSSSASSSSESFKLLSSDGKLRRHKLAKDSPTTTPPTQMKLNSSSTGDRSINQPNHHHHHHQVDVRRPPLVAMQQQHAQHHQHHRRAHSSAGPLSWSRQQLEHEQAASIGNHHSLLLANNNASLNGHQLHQFVDVYDPYQAAAYQQRQQQQQQQYHELSSSSAMKIPHNINNNDAQQQMERQLYATNYAHLLANQQQQPYGTQDGPYFQQSQYSTLGHMSAPMQRRFKWSKPQQQQYHFLNSNDNDEQTLPSHIDQQQCLSVNVPAQMPRCTTDLDGAFLDQAHHQQLHHHQDPTQALYQGHPQHNYYLQQPVQSQDASLSTLKSRRSKSLGKSPGLKSRNPLAAIFPFALSSSSQRAPAPTSAPNFQRALSSSKSHQNLAGGSSKGSSSTLKQPASNSLKRIKSTPLTAQQTSYEAMRTIDMYLIRQIARSCMDFEMEQKIDLEIRLRELAAQSMLEARNEIDVLEVEKSLLTSDQRMNCYASQLEQQRRRLSQPTCLSISGDSGRGSTTISTTNTNLAPTRKDSSLRRTGATRQHRSDVVGSSPTGAGGYGGSDTASPTTYSSLASKSSQSSPSKLSPVSGQSANSPGAQTTASSAAPSPTGTGHSNRPTSNQNHQTATRQATANSNNANTTTLNRNKSQQHKSLKHKQRERLVQYITNQSNINCNMTVNNRATLELSELRVPLMWRDVDHFKGRGDYRRYAVFCLAKIGPQIYDTQLISDVDRQMTDLNFDDVLVFHNVEHDFELELEVYSCVYLEQFSLSSTPRKLKERLSNSVSRAMGRRLATQTASVNYTKELEAYDKSYRFAMIASAKLSLADASSSTKTYDLMLVSPEAHGRQTNSSRAGQLDGQLGNNPLHQSRYCQLPAGSNHNGMVTASNQRDLHKNTLPLFGHFCCRLHAQPDVFDKNAKSGYLRVATVNLPDTLLRQRLSEEEEPKSPKKLNNGNNNEKALDVDGASACCDGTMLRSALAASSKLATVSLSNSTVHWAALRNFTLNMWQIDEHKLQLAIRRGHAPQVDISRKQPIRVTIDKHARLLRVSNSSLTIETEKGCFVLAVYNPTTKTTTDDQTPDEIGHWLRSIEQMIYDSHIWSSALNHHHQAHQQSEYLAPGNNYHQQQYSIN